MGVGCQHHAPAALPPGKTQYPLHRRLGGPQGLSEQVRKISPPPGFDPRTVQPVASRCIGSSNPAIFHKLLINISLIQFFFNRMLLKFPSPYLYKILTRMYTKKCALPDYYVTSSCNSLPTFRENLSVPFSRVKILDTWPSLRNNPEECSSHPLCSEGLISRTATSSLQIMIFVLINQRKQVNLNLKKLVLLFHFL